MKEIKLTKGQIAFVDDEYFEYLNQWKWFAVKSRDTYYANRRIKDSDGNIKAAIMHRIIMCAKNDTQVDHRDSNGLNNQKSNLRLCSNGQNQMNRGGWRKSKYKGVTIKNSYYKDRHYIYIRARINVGNKQFHLGNFKTEPEAAEAYNEAALKYHGDFARLNVITKEKAVENNRP